MKAIVSNELKKRLEFASKNGSVVATDILNELKKDKKDCLGNKTADYFDSVRVVGSSCEYKTLKIVVTLCNKDLNNEHFPDRNNPRAPYFKENRERINLGTFVGLFTNLGGYTSNEMNWFESAMCVADVVKYRLSDRMSDFERAYFMSNYFPYGMSNSPLHNSCMRYEEKARNAANFYTNFAGAKILIAEDSQGQILGRAIVWDNVIFPHLGNNNAPTKVIDRMYFCYEFIRLGMMRHAVNELGIYVRKASNSANTQHEFYFYKESGFEGLRYENARITVPQIKWHKKGAPYMDTFLYLNVDDGTLYLSNYAENSVAMFSSTGGYGLIERSICPSCGKRTRNNALCDSCFSSLIQVTPFGNIIRGRTKTYNGNKYPQELFDGNKPSKHFLNWIGLKKLTDEYFSL